MDMHAPPSDLLKAAEAIGRALSKSAVWDDAAERCNWIGRADIEDPAGTGLTTGVLAIYTHLAGGSAGVALFLGELAARTRDPEAHRTALGALHRTLAYARSKQVKGHPFSFLTGHLGIAYVLLRFQDLALINDAADDIAWCFAELKQAFDAPHPLDFMGGTAGVVPGLLHFGPSFGGGDALRLAERCGEELCAAAERTEGMAYWDSTRAIGRGMSCPPLTGLSHGASGMALALLELHAATGRQDFLDVAREAFVYEDRLYSPKEGNWIDVRFPYSVAGAEPEGKFQIAWCHGAPGIALARLRAAQIDADRADEYYAKAERALEATAIGAVEKLSHPRWDTSLCHGLAGLSEVLLLASEMMAGRRWRERSGEIVAELIRRYGRAGDWPGGTSTSDFNPALLLGSTGTGHHLLRLLDSEATPPVLMIRPWERAVRSDGKLVEGASALGLR